MRFGTSGELVFGSTTEARIASDLLIREAGSDMLRESGLQPPLDNPKIGLIASWRGRLQDDSNGGQEHVIADPQMSKHLVQMLAIASMPDNVIFPPRYTRPLRRASFIQKQVQPLLQSFHRSSTTDQ